MARQNLLGKRFGRLLVVDYAPDYIAPDGHKHPKWKCRCDCGNEVVVRQSSLLGGCSQSCGCLRKEQISYRAKHHGGFGTRLYNVWNSMRQRCNNPTPNLIIIMGDGAFRSVRNGMTMAYFAIGL